MRNSSDITYTPTPVRATDYNTIYTKNIEYFVLTGDTHIHLS